MRAAVTKAKDLLSKEEIRAFTVTSDLAGARAVLVTWGLVAASFVTLARFPNPLTFVAAIVVIGGRQLALSVLMHEAAHGTLFRTRALNEILADWLCARPVWAHTARYRKHHLGHHAHTGTELDPDMALVTPFPVPRASLVRKLSRDLIGVSALKRLVGLALMDAERIAYDVSGTVNWLPRRSLGAHLAAFLRNAAGFFLTNALLFATLALTGHAWLYSAWVVAYLTTYGAFLRIRSIAEHACMPGGADILANTRTTRAGLLARLTVSPHDVGYHLEHHLVTTVPYFRLRKLHELLVARGALPPESVANGYLEVLRTAAR